MRLRSSPEGSTAAEGVPVVASAVGEVAPRGGVAVCSGEDDGMEDSGKVPRLRRRQWRATTSDG